MKKMTVLSIILLLAAGCSGDKKAKEAASPAPQVSGAASPAPQVSGAASSAPQPHVSGN